MRLVVLGSTTSRRRCGFALAIAVVLFANAASAFRGVTTDTPCGDALAIEAGHGSTLKSHQPNAQQRATWAFEGKFSKTDAAITYVCVENEIELQLVSVHLRDEHEAKGFFEFHVRRTSESMGQPDREQRSALLPDSLEDGELRDTSQAMWASQEFVFITLWQERDGAWTFNALGPLPETAARNGAP